MKDKQKLGGRKTNAPAGRPGRQPIRRKDSKIQEMNEIGMEDEEIDQQREVFKSNAY